MQSAVTDTSGCEDLFPLPVVHVRAERLSSSLGKDPSLVLPELPSALPLGRLLLPVLLQNLRQLRRQADRSASCPGFRRRGVRPGLLTLRTESRLSATRVVVAAVLVLGA